MIALEERTAVLVEMYGECCTRIVASKILGIDRTTVARLIRDGMLESACAGKKVDVRSIAEYICTPAPVREEKRRKLKVIERTGQRWAV